MMTREQEIDIIERKRILEAERHNNRIEEIKLENEAKLGQIKLQSSNIRKNDESKFERMRAYEDEKFQRYAMIKKGKGE